jgi:hypothetical protein
MAFWGNNYSSVGPTDPKRKFRFTVQVGGLHSDIMWFASTATKPSFSIAVGDHKFLNHTFNFPGALTWNDVTITFVDPGDDLTAAIGDNTSKSAAAGLAQLAEAIGYVVPDDSTALSTMTKSKHSANLGTVTVTQINGDGKDIEQWSLYNPIVTEMKWGDSLSYGDDGLTEMSITFKYDWASLAVNTNTGGERGSETAGTTAAPYFDGGTAAADTETEEE